MMFPFGIILGFGNGFQPVAGFNWGAKLYDRVEESYRFSSRAALIGSAAMAVLFAVFAGPIITLFAGDDPEMHKIGVVCVNTQCIALPIHAWGAIENMLCVGLGNAIGSLVLATARQGSCCVPILYPLAWLGAYGVASVQAVADVLTLAMAIPIVLSMLKKIRLAKQEPLLSE